MLNQYIVPAFFLVEAESVEEAEALVDKAQDAVIDNLPNERVDILLDELVPTMYNPHPESIEIHSVLNLISIQPSAYFMEKNHAK